MATYADGMKEYRLSDKVGNLYNDPDKKLRKYLEGGRIEKSGEWTFKYDKDGQLIEKFRGNAGFFGTKKDRWKYSWTQAGVLEGVRSPHRYGQWTRFTYDALGRRLTKLGDATFHYLWNGNVPLHEWRTGERYEDGSLKSYSEDLKTWLFEEESFVPLALIQEGKAYSIVCDQLGTPTEAYDEEGREVWYRRLDMNGKILEETQPGLNPEGYVSIPFLFQGQYYDHETGLAYNRFRYYDPELGRYILEDPIRLLGGITLHAYVEDSLMGLDPLGLSPSRALSWSVCSQGVSRRALPMTTSVGLSIARHASPPRYAESVDTTGGRLTAYSRRRIAVMALLRMSIVLRGICKRQPMLTVQKSIVYRTR